MKLLVTGASGYLGSALLRRACERGWETIGTYLSTPPERSHSGNRASMLTRLEVRDEAAVETLLATVRPHCVVHTAYSQAETQMRTTNVDGAAVVARAARRAGARLIHLSSDLVFDGAREGAYVEEDVPRPVTPYGETKALAEAAVAGAHPGALIVRTSLLYGGAMPSRHERLALEAADGRVEVTFFTDEIRCPVQVGDLAAALLELAARDESGPLHVAGADAVSRYELACLVARAQRRSPERLRGAPSAASGVLRPRNCSLDSSRARAILRTRLRGVREVLQA